MKGGIKLSSKHSGQRFTAYMYIQAAKSEVLLLLAVGRGSRMSPAGSRHHEPVHTRTQQHV